MHACGNCGAIVGGRSYLVNCPCKQAMCPHPLVCWSCFKSILRNLRAAQTITDRQS